MSSSLLTAFLVVLAAGAGVLAVADLSPGETPGPGAGDATTTDVTDSPDDSSDDRTDVPDEPTSTTTDDSAYDFTIENVEECGSTCRDVTAVLANTGDETRRNVRVTTEVYADGDLLWSGNETVGSLAPGETHTSTKRVEVGLAGGMKIRDDGYVTIVTVVRSDDGTTRFSERRKVA